MARNQNPNPHNLTKGDKVMLSPRKDGVEHRDGNDAVWELMEDPTASGIATLHLVGADKSRTCGAIVAALRPISAAELAPIPLDGTTYVSGAFQMAYDAKKATGWAPKGKVTITNLDGPSTTHVFLTDASDVDALTDIVADANGNTKMLKAQRARDQRVKREQAKFLARTAK